MGLSGLTRWRYAEQRNERTIDGRTTRRVTTKRSYRGQTCSLAPFSGDLKYVLVNARAGPHVRPESRRLAGRRNPCAAAVAGLGLHTARAAPARERG